MTLGSSTSLVVGLLAFGVALIFAGGFLYLRSRNGRADSEDQDLEQAGFLDDGGEDIDTLLDALLALDDQYKAGELPEDAYVMRRDELKSKIKKELGS